MNNIGLEMRASMESRNIYGQAISFETESTGLPWKEIIHRGAITEDTINNSDIIFNYNHDRSQILARSYKGNGSLHVELREDGVYFDFDAPNTRFGDEILEQVRRGDLMRCSFCFDLTEEDFKRSVREDGQKQVDIYNIRNLYDFSVVSDAAYDSTFINSRQSALGLDEELDIQVREAENDISEPDSDTNNTDNDSESEEIEETKEEETEEQERSSEITENKSNQSTLVEETQKSNIFEKRKMEKQFSLLRAVRAIANNQQLDPIDAAVINEGAQAFRKAGVEFGGQIQLPNLLENRAAVTVTDDGEDIVATEIYDILGPLRSRNVLVQAGAKFMTGLVGNVQVPVMSATNVTWEGETASASDAAGVSGGLFSHVTLSPKRLTAYIDISKQFLVQDGVGAESVIREDLIKAINAKLESTILGAASGTSTQPQGIFDAVSATYVSDFAGIVNLEASVEEANVFGELKYICSPKAKAKMRSMIKGTNATGMVYENESVDGTPALVTTHVSDDKYVAGDFSNLAIGQWGAIDLTVDPYTKAGEGQVRLVINAFFDAKLLRPASCFAAGTFTSSVSSAS